MHKVMHKAMHRAIHGAMHGTMRGTVHRVMREATKSATMNGGIWALVVTPSQLSVRVVKEAEQTGQKALAQVGDEKMWT